MKDLTRGPDKGEHVWIDSVKGIDFKKVFLKFSICIMHILVSDLVSEVNKNVFEFENSYGVGGFLLF